jgi:hypothetical protein
VETEILIIIIVAGLVIIVAGILALLALQKRRSGKLREKFGPEYDYTVNKVGEPHKAEAILQERVKRVEGLEIRDLGSHEQEIFHEKWIGIQAAFVDEPSSSVEEANRLIKEVMMARGFPVADFEHRVEDVSVAYPHFVSDYRSAHEIAVKNQREGASTEELRQAMVYYRSLFNELLDIEEEEIDVERETK